MSTTSIRNHEGNKYLREIFPAVAPEGAEIEDASILIDVYCVIVAFNVKCPARAHAIKKLLCAGLRGKGGEKADLVGALAAVNRAIELQSVSESQQVEKEASESNGQGISGGKTVVPNQELTPAASGSIHAVG